MTVVSVMTVPSTTGFLAALKFDRVGIDEFQIFELHVGHAASPSCWRLPVAQWQARRAGSF
jgi:hypothetical protein